MLLKLDKKKICTETWIFPYASYEADADFQIDQPVWLSSGS